MKCLRVLFINKIILYLLKLVIYEILKLVAEVGNLRLVRDRRERGCKISLGRRTICGYL